MSEDQIKFNCKLEVVTVNPKTGDENFLVIVTQIDNGEFAYIEYSWNKLLDCYSYHQVTDTNNPFNPEAIKFGLERTKFVRGKIKEDIKELTQ